MDKTRLAERSMSYDWCQIVAVGVATAALAAFAAWAVTLIPAAIDHEIARAAAQVGEVAK